MWLDPNGRMHTLVPDVRRFSNEFVGFLESLTSEELRATRLEVSILETIVGAISGGPERYTRTEEDFRGKGLPTDIFEEFVNTWREQGWKPELVGTVNPRWRMDLIDVVDSLLCDEIERRELEYLNVDDA